MRTHIGKFLTGNIYRAIFTLVGGTVIARVVTVLSLPVLTRIYEPADFELLAFFIAITSMLSVVAGLRFHLAITLPAHDEEAASLLAISLLSSFLFSCVLFAALAYFPHLVSSSLGQKGFLPYSWMIPFAVLSVAWYQSLQYWSSRKKRFPIVAQTNVTRAVGGTLAQVGLGYYGIGTFALLLGMLVQYVVGVLGLIRSVVKSDRVILATLSTKSMLAAGLEYRRFPRYSVPEALANSAAIQLPVIIIAAVVDGPEAGYLLLAMQVLAVPMTFIGKSVAQVYISEAPARMREGTLTKFTSETCFKLFVVAVAVLIPIGILSPAVVPLIFGSEWARAGEILLWMVPWHIAQFASSPISSVLHVQGRLLCAMCLQIGGLLLRVGSVLVAVALTDGWVVEVYAISGFLFYGVYILVILLSLDRSR